MAFTESLDVFLADFGVAVVFGATSGTGIFDSPDSVFGDGIGISTEYTILVKSSVFSALKFGDAITVGGVSYSVREPKILDDGSFMRVSLSKV